MKFCDQVLIGLAGAAGVAWGARAWLQDLAGRIPDVLNQVIPPGTRPRPI